MFLIEPEVCSLHLRQQGYDAGKHPLVYRYMKVVSNSNPSLTKRSFTWDAGAVAKYLSSIVLKSLHDISRKLVSLLAS